MVYGILKIERLNLFTGDLLLQPQPQDLEAPLIERAIKRNPAAFTDLYDRYVDRVYRYVYYRVTSQSDSEDITQEVFVRAWKNIHKYQQRGRPFAAWLFAIARNLITDHYRNRKNLVPLDDVANSTQVDGVDLQKEAEDSFDRTQVRSAVAKLKGDRQRVIRLRFIDGFSYEEIAQILKKSEGAIRVIQYRALQDLRRILMRG